MNLDELTKKLLELHDENFIEKFLKKFNRTDIKKLSEYKYFTFTPLYKFYSIIDIHINKWMNTENKSSWYNISNYESGYFKSNNFMLIKHLKYKPNSLTNCFHVSIYPCNSDSFFLHDCLCISENEPYGIDIRIERHLPTKCKYKEYEDLTGCSNGVT